MLYTSNPLQNEQSEFGNYTSGPYVTKLSITNDYILSYKRTQLIDELHELSGFKTNYKFMTKVIIRTIVKNSKPLTKKNGSSPTLVVGLDLFLWSRCLQFCGFAGYILWLTRPCLWSKGISVFFIQVV
ncbi:MAG TPA: hypothetical protein DCP59_04745 [Megasphaera sp.]|nr:hypothetical protein [Megasphaera sp.]